MVQEQHAEVVQHTTAVQARHIVRLVAVTCPDPIPPVRVPTALHAIVVAAVSRTSQPERTRVTKVGKVDELVLLVIIRVANPGIAPRCRWAYTDGLLCERYSVLIPV